MLLKPRKILVVNEPSIVFLELFSCVFRGNDKLTCTKLSKFKEIIPPPVSLGGLKHFRNTNRYNDCAFDDPLYQLASHLYNEFYREFNVSILSCRSN